VRGPLLTINKNVVEENKQKFAEINLKNIIHGGLKSGWPFERPEDQY